MSTWQWVLIVFGVLMVAKAVVLVAYWPRLQGAYRGRVARERGGHRVMQDRMRAGLGRTYQSTDHVERAEYGRGWVWFVMFKDPPDQRVERVGWHLFKRGAERASDRTHAAIIRNYQDQQQSRGRR